MLSPETIAEMSNWNTLIIFILLVSLCAFSFAAYVYMVIDMLVAFVKFVIRKIKEKQKGAVSDEDTHPEH